VFNGILRHADSTLIVT
jgi:hypothetical protein